MSRPTTTEQEVLFSAKQVLQGFSPEYKEQILVIAMCPSINGGFDVSDYWQSMGICIEPKKYSIIRDIAIDLKKEIEITGIPFPVALSSLSRKPIPLAEQKKEGAFYTDYRLSSIASSICEQALSCDSSVADIAAGTGILLSSIAVLYYKKFPQFYNNWIAKRVFAFDLSSDALRGAMASLASLSNSVKAVFEMRSKWAIVDSLTTDLLSGLSFDIVIGNPPWGKIKLSRHQYSLEQGIGHTYGSDYKDLDLNSYNHEKALKEEYSQLIKEKYSLLGDSDSDFYVAFLQKSLSVLSPNGMLVYIIPAGLIRSKGTTELRRFIFSRFSDVEIRLFDNRAHYFSIDTRFKFLVLSLNNTTKSCDHVVLRNYKGPYQPNCAPQIIPIDLADLSKCRKDLSVPEVCSSEELELFFRINKNGSFSLWQEMHFCRELDMTNDRAYFDPGVLSNGIPIIEGRMVQPYRVGAKRYVSGTGRKAIWSPNLNGLFPQFSIKDEYVPIDIKKRIANKRIGYCDIAGQTNERSMMAAIIPDNTICGNKVPTILFNGEDAEDKMYFCLGVFNSVVFDWMLRRVLSTTVNYFLLQSIPLPRLEISAQDAQIIIKNSRILSDMGEEYYFNNILMYKCRAEIDVLVAKAYKLHINDLRIILNDFPLLDKGQFSIKGYYSITKAYILSYGERILAGRNNSEFDGLLGDLSSKGAMPYVLNDMKELYKNNTI